MANFIITRPEPQRISLDEWLKCIADSPGLLPTAPREGINPFTRKPHLFRPAPGSVYFDTPAGRCSIGFHNGALLADGPDPECFDLIDQIAVKLDAHVTRRGD